jgi:hypothetical protein
MQIVLLDFSSSRFQKRLPVVTGSLLPMNDQKFVARDDPSD